MLEFKKQLPQLDPLIIDAAKRGAGVALGWRYIIDDEITKGTLVRPVTDTVKTSFAYHIVWPFNVQLSPNTLKFRDWIIAERNVLK